MRKKKDIMKLLFYFHLDTNMCYVQEYELPIQNV